MSNHRYSHLGRLELLELLDRVEAERDKCLGGFEVAQRVGLAHADRARALETENTSLREALDAANDTTESNIKARLALEAECATLREALEDALPTVQGVFDEFKYHETEEVLETMREALAKP